MLELSTHNQHITYSFTNIDIPRRWLCSYWNGNWGKLLTRCDQQEFSNVSRRYATTIMSTFLTTLDHSLFPFFSSWGPLYSSPKNALMLLLFSWRLNLTIFVSFSYLLSAIWAPKIYFTATVHVTRGLYIALQYRNFYIILSSRISKQYDTSSGRQLPWTISKVRPRIGFGEHSGN